MREAWFHDPDDQQFREFRFIQNYPAWYCGEIRNLVLAKLRKADIPYIKKFCDAWGILGEEYVGVNHPSGKRWFSNVIQVGNRVIDTAHEEFSGTTLSVNISDFGKIFHPPTVRCYKELTEIYHGKKVLSSFPILGKFSLLFPFLMIDSLWRIEFGPKARIHTHIQVQKMESAILLQERNLLHAPPEKLQRSVRALASQWKTQEARESIYSELHGLWFHTANIDFPEVKDYIDMFLGDIAKKKGRDFEKEVSSLFSLDEEEWKILFSLISQTLYFLENFYNLELGKRYTLDALKK